ncbi:class I SAM-dependent methyltransferase [Desulfobacula phenolica]|uniref:Methyltransferase domain-containing protein n=1 Tax=Desulfobacula phenolica TaxID=90732 RepID=A0A1H2GMV2_9BACT|nr:methyltransferase domain-containing protein [Desulfobacula phenolica]SDU20874.1 Methyltransferase domain-containing protein [Desulfobacula phenolica]
MKSKEEVLKEGMARKNCKQKHGHKGQGPSSFWMHDPEFVFDALEIRSGDRVLDLGCGAGDYSVKASGIVGDSGLVYAIDHWPPTIDALKKSVESLGLTNIKPLVSDLLGILPVKDNDIDICLIFTVLHIFDISRQGRGIYNEVSRILKPGGRLAIIECKKEEMPFGPPIHMRLSPEEVELSIKDSGFEKTGVTDLGYNYLIQFVKNY